MAAKSFPRAWTRSRKLEILSWPPRLAEPRQIALAQGKRGLRVRDPHRLRELGLRMRADPGDEQQAAQHHEGLDLGFVLGRERADAPVAPHPRLDERRHLRAFLEKRHRRRAVI